MSRLLAWLWRQLGMVYRLTFQPDLDSAVYLNRTRLNIAVLTMVGLDLVYALLWIFVFHGVRSSSSLLIFAAACSALAFINLHYRFIPWFSQLATVVFCLWLNMPVLALYIYLSVDPPVNALANTIILLVLYMHIQDWRSSVLGIALACLVAPSVYFLSMGSWPSWPPLLQIFMLLTVLGGSIVVAISSANLTKMRKRYTQKVLQVTQEQLRPSLLLQTELIGNIRYEARNILQDERQRLAVDRLAMDLKAQVDQLGLDITRLVQAGSAGLTEDWQAVGLLPCSEILVMARNDLMASYHFDAAFLEQALQLELQDDAVIEANGAEISQAIAALLDAMLKASQSAHPESPPRLTLRCWQQGHVGKFHIQAEAFTEQPLKPALPPNLPPFTVYIFRLLHIHWQVRVVFPDASPAHIELSCPLPSHSGTLSP